MTIITPSTLPAFTEEQKKIAHSLLASNVATMMGRKLEEGDWVSVYCKAKGIPDQGWSNLKIDVMYQGLGVEQKMLCVRSDKSIKEHCGMTLMHPAATRSIRISSTEGDATEVARDVLRQYGELIEQRRQTVRIDSGGKDPDMRTGWLLWQVDLREFLYFEEEMVAPNPENYYAVWKESGGGARKKSVNLWVYESDTNKKRYSITTEAGAKIQPYFDVPSPNDPNLYYFLVQGEPVDNSLVRLWITRNTALLIREKLGSLDTKIVSEGIARSSEMIQELISTGTDGTLKGIDFAIPIEVTQEAYQLLTQFFSGISDEHMMQLFAKFIWEAH